MSLWLMAAALEHQTRSQEIRAICAEAMRIPAGRGGIYAGAQYAHIVNRLTEWAHAVIYSYPLFYELHELTLIKPYGRKVRNWRI